MKHGKARPEFETAPVIWAVDPFEVETRPRPSAVRELLRWTRSAGLPILPVHLLSVPRIDHGPETESTWISRYVPSARKAVDQYLRDLDAGTTQPPVILLDHSASRKSAVQRVLGFADDLGSPLIVVSSHGRSGVQRLVFGSFAENLLLQSRHPVLFLTHAHQDAQIQHVLFPTDFTEYSKEAFRRFLPQAKRLGADVTLFHSVAIPQMAMSGAGVMGVPALIPENFLAEQADWARKEGARWIQDAKMAGVTARITVEEGNLSSHVSRSVLEAAQKIGAGLIAMASVSGAVSAFVAGSVARDLLRANAYPVWVCGPQLLEKAGSRTADTERTDSPAIPAASA